MYCNCDSALFNIKPEFNLWYKGEQKLPKNQENDARFTCIGTIKFKNNKHGNWREEGKNKNKMSFKNDVS